MKDPQIAIGLENIAVVETSLSMIDGENGKIQYRNYRTDEKLLEKSFEEVAHLLWYGHLPDSRELSHFCALFAKERALPLHVKSTIDNIPQDVSMMSVLQTAVSVLNQTESHWPPTIEQAIFLAAKIPTIIGYRQAQLNGRIPLEPREDLDHASNYLYLVNGHEPTAVQKEILESYLILTQELGTNPSTFTARVVASTQSDIFSSVSAALGALRGPLHGGAPSEVTAMLRSIGTKENTEDWLRDALENDRRLMGFGHRVFKKVDPRSKLLRDICEKYRADHPLIDLAIHVEQMALELLNEYKPGRSLVTNVDYYASVIMSTVGLPDSLFTPTFAVSRTVGWSAHILEQAANNRLIYPKALFTGDIASEFASVVALDETDDWMEQKTIEVRK